MPCRMRAPSALSDSATPVCMWTIPDSRAAMSPFYSWWVLRITPAVLPSFERRCPMPSSSSFLARAAAGTSGHPTIFYIGFDNGGLWRTSDFGSNWEPLFDREATGSIGAIAVAPSNPNIIYVGTGAGIIRPDLATGNGVYKSTDAGRTWTHLGLDSTLMIAMVDVDPTNPDRLFVAALGHPYGPNAERGIYRSTDGGRTFE